MSRPSLACLGQPDVLELVCQEAIWHALGSLACLDQPDVLELASQEEIWRT